MKRPLPLRLNPEQRLAPLPLRVRSVYPVQVEHMPHERLEILVRDVHVVAAAVGAAASAP